MSCGKNATVVDKIQQFPITLIIGTITIDSHKLSLVIIY